MFVFTHIASLLLNGIGSLQKVRCLTLVFGLLLTGIGFPLYAQIEQEFCIDKFPDKIEICVDLEPGEFLDPDGSTSVFDCSLSPSGDFCVKYTPLPLFEGPDTVLIQICKIADPDDCYFLTYIVYVGCIQPDAVNDAANANGTTTIDVTANDWVKCADISGIKIKTNPTHGTAVVSGLNIIYTPDECYNGTDKIIYELINSCGKKDVATVNLTVSANNVAPDAKNDTGTSTDGNQVCVSVLNNDFDADGDAMTINTFGQGTNGVVVKSGNKLCYTPNSGFSGTDVFTYKICDPCNLCDQATVAITVEKLNQPPVANNDEGTTEGDPVCIKVMTNDYDPDGDPIAVTTYTQPIKGSVNYNPSTKEFCFTPTNNCFDYVTTFKYTICDDGSPKLCDEATVTITVNGDNQPPVLKNDNATSDGSTVCINVLANDNDPDGDVLHISNYTQPANGSVVIDPGTKKLCYTPNSGFEGTDSFQYCSCDPCGETSCATVTIIVELPNNPPVANNDEGTTEGDPVCIKVMTNDYDPDGDPIAVTNYGQPSQGTVTYNPLTKELCYDPKDDCYEGVVTFSYTICDNGSPKLCDDAVVTITVINDNIAPDAKNDALESDGSQVCKNVLSNDSDADGDVLSISMYGQGSNGVVIKAGSQLCYTPNAGFEGSDSFTYTVCDDCGLCDQATVTVMVVLPNNPPVANNDEGTTEGDPVCIKVMTNDYDPDGDPIAVTNYGQPSQGTVTYNPLTKELCYDPKDDCYEGVVTFSYTICDNGSPKLCDDAVVTITVINDNIAPDAKNDALESDGSQVCKNVLSNDSDADGDVLSISMYGQGSNGVVIKAGSQLCYTPNAGFEGSDSFTYTICDDCGLCDQATVTVTVVLPNNPPVANNDEGTTEGDPVCIKVMTNDYDPDGDPIAVTNYGQPSQGTVTYNPLTKELCYDPKDDCYEGLVTFSYTICDNGSPKLCDDAVVTITVINDNIAPDAKNDALESDGSQVCKNVLSNDSDADGDVLSISMYGQGSNGVVIKAGSQLCYTPNAGFEGSDSFTYTVCDDCGLCDQATVTVTVDIPCEPEVLEICADPLIPVTVCPQFCLEDWTIVEVEALFKCGIKLKEKCFIYTALPGQFGSDELIVKACDDFGNCETTIVYVIIGCGGNQPPFAQNDDVTTPQNQEGCLYPMNNDFDPDGDPITIEAISPPANGFIIYDDETGELCYTPGLGFSGVEIFTYQVCDNKGACTSATITIVVTTDCEEDLFLCTKPLTPIIICPAFCTLNGEVQIIDAETTYNCSIKILPDGCVKYTSLPLFAGQETVTITGCDTNGNCETVTYIIEVSEDCDGEGFGLIPEHKDEIGSETSNKGQSGTPKMQINVSNYINGHVSIAYFVPTETVYRLAVTDMSGRLVYNTTVDASVSGWQPQMNLPTQHLSKGVYLVTITQDNDRANKVSAKFIAF